MGLNLGAMAGGVAKGWSQGIDDQAKKDDAEWKKKERERQDDERNQYEEIIKSTHGEFKEGLKAAGGEAMPMQDAYGAEPTKPGMVMDGIISNQVAGRQPAPASVNSIVAQGIDGSAATPSGRPLSAAAQGIMRPTAESEMLQQTRAKEPTYREPDINDKFNYSDKLYGRLIEAGLFDKAKEVGQFRSGLLAEKLQGETKAREDAVRGGVAAIKSRNPKAILAALQSVSQFVPDGNDVTNVQMSGDGKYQITYGDNPPIAMDEGQLTSSILGAGKVETILDYDHRLQQTAFQKAQEERLAKHQDAVLKNQATEIGIRQSEHKDKRADAEKQKADAIEKVNAAVAIHKERNPNATPAQIEAVRRGVMEAIPKNEDAKETVYTYDDQGNKTSEIERKVKSQQVGAQDVTVGGKVIGKAATAEEARALVEQYKKGQQPTTQPSPSIVQQPVAQNIKTAAKPRDVRVIQAELNQLKELPSYVNQDVKNAQRAKYAALMAERDAAMGNKSAATSIGSVISRYGVGH